MSQQKLKRLLTDRLSLREPVFRLERNGSKIFGSIISPSFKGKSDMSRLRWVWDAIEAEVGREWRLQVGTLLLYTPAEWNIDLPQAG